MGAGAAVGKDAIDGLGGGGGRRAAGGGGRRLSEFQESGPPGNALRGRSRIAAGVRGSGEEGRRGRAAR